MIYRKRPGQKRKKDLANQVKELKSLIKKRERDLEAERERICRDLVELCKKRFKKRKRSDPSDPPWHYGPRCPHP
jgi:hypothetical protein